MSLKHITILCKTTKNAIEYLVKMHYNHGHSRQNMKKD